MKSKTLLKVLPILCGFAFVFVPHYAYAHNGHDHGDKIGGGCNDCTPPTLGLNEAGKRQVYGGFKVNDQTYDVELFKQELITQMLKIGEPAEITLKIYNDGGYDSLKHVELGLGYEEKLISGVMVPQNFATIEWDNTFDGKIDVKYNDPYDLLSDVDVKVIDNSPIIEFKFTFTPTSEFDANTMVTKMWDMKRNSNTNYFYNVFEIKSNQLPLMLIATEDISSVQFEEKPIQKISPVDEINQGVECNTEQKKLLRVSNMYPVCVNAYQSEVLISYNWAILAQ